MSCDHYLRTLHHHLFLELVCSQDLSYLLHDRYLSSRGRYLASSALKIDNLSLSREIETDVMKMRYIHRYI